MSPPRRIMMYSQDSYGLGHLRRATNLANALVAQRSDVSVLLVVDSPVAPFFELANHVDYIKLPTVFKVDAGVFRPGQLPDSYDLIKTIRENVLREAVEGYRPDVVLVDHMPGGANRELLPALRALREHGAAKLVLGLRDIIDRPEVTCDVWQREGAYDLIRELYDRVFVYGTREVFSTADAYAIVTGCADVCYCGYVCNMDAVKEPRRIRAKLGVGDSEPIVAVMSGGGWDGYRLQQTFLEAIKHVRARRPVAALVVTGPFMPDAKRKRLRELARAMGVRIHNTVGDPMSQINAADVVVSMAGYNTLTEILRFNKRAVIVPRPGPSAEQRMRCRLFRERGLIDVLDPDDLSAETLADAIDRSLDAPDPTAVIPAPGLGGVAEVTRLLLESLPGNGETPGAHVTVEPRAPGAAVRR